ncbi:hypothetical protein ACSSS7_001738 [Eimeria intestinalis]
MTFLHGAACAVFSFGPPVAIYKGAGLSDQSGTTWLLSLASIFYFLNLFAKSLLVASFLPAATCESSVICSLAVDLITAIMEVNTIKYLLSQKHMLGLVEPPQRFLSDAVTPLCWAALGLQGAVAVIAGAACYTAFTTRQQQPHAHKLD